MDDPQERKRPNDGKRRLYVLVGTMCALGACFTLSFQPVHSRCWSLCFLASALCAYCGLAALAWRRKRLRVLMLFPPLLLTSVFLLPSREIDSQLLRDDYVSRLRTFEGTPYKWGGENARGIDCSGLPRRAYRDALLSYGIRHADGGALRAFLEHWWYDASAESLGNGYRNYTTDVSSRGTVRTLDTTNLQPGDLAVTRDGLHVLVYLGENRWIQADPDSGRVITADGKNDANRWFDTPVSIRRWRLLSASR